MVSIIQKRLKQTKFESVQQEAVLNLLLATHHIKQRREQVCADFGVTTLQYNVLRILKGVAPKGHPRHEIITRMVERAPDVTRVIDRLKKMGLVERSRSDKDRRLSIARLSAKGLAFMNEIYPYISTFDNHYLADRLTDQECIAFSRLCEKIYEDEV